MSKYKKQDILDYISNNLEIEHKKELENNAEFMLEVISLTKDSKYYYNCSKELQNDHNFNISVAYLFSNDEKFLIDILTKQLENASRTQFEKMEYYILLGGLYDITKKDIYLKYKFKETALLHSIITYINKEKKEDETTFEHILNKYENKSTINYFAFSMIQDIFIGEESSSLEAIIHKNFKTKEELEKSGEFTFLIGYIKQKDNALANYLLINQYLLYFLFDEINVVKNDWDQYLKKLNDNRSYLVYKELNNYIKEFGKIEGFNYKKYLKQLIETLGFTNELKDIFYEDDIIKELDNELELSNVEEKIKPIQELTLHELAFIIHMKKYITNLFNEDLIKVGSIDNVSTSQR